MLMWVSVPTQSDIATLASDAVFEDNLKSAIAKTLAIQKSDVTITTVNMSNRRLHPDSRSLQATNRLQIVYEVACQDASAASAVKNSLDSAAFSTSMESNLRDENAASPPAVVPTISAGAVQ